RFPTRSIGKAKKLICLGASARSWLPAAAASFGSEADRLCESPARLGVVRRDHRIILWQVPLRPIGVGCHIIRCHQVAAEHLELFAVLKAHNVIGLYRGAD